MKIKQWIYKAIRIVVLVALAPSVLAVSGHAFARNGDPAAEAEYRAGIIQTIVDTWQYTEDATNSSRWQLGITTLLQRLSTDNLEYALNAGSYADLTGILKSSVPESATAPGFDKPLLATAQLYYPLDPCRLVDTRSATGEYTGPVGTAVTANYHAKDSAEIGNQGGLSGGCSVPATATALVINITSTQQAGNGHLRAYPYGGSLPNASIVNFSGATIANATILPICEGTCSYDFSIYASQSSHVIVDVMGYFAD